jgi:hypothetical protein
MSGRRGVAAHSDADLLDDMDFPHLGINVDMARCFVSIDDLNLVDDPAIVFAHIDRNDRIRLLQIRPSFISRGTLPKRRVLQNRA